MTAVLHTWGQTLTRHVHLHCLVPGGALDTDAQWHPAHGSYLFPVRALSRHFRGRMVSELRQACQRGELSRIIRPCEIDRVLANRCRKTKLAQIWASHRNLRQLMDPSRTRTPAGPARNALAWIPT